MSAEPRYTFLPEGVVNIHAIERCLDCGALLFSGDKPAHTRFHSILSGHAWSLAVLKTSHIAAHSHDRYDVVERIDSRRFDSWSADALEEVAGAHPFIESALNIPDENGNYGCSQCGLPLSAHKDHGDGAG